jgi:hypothetical protein
VVCLQELKAPDAAFPINDIHAAGYGAIWHGQASWNGVAILAKGMDPLESRRGLPDDEHRNVFKYQSGRFLHLLLCKSQHFLGKSTRQFLSPARRAALRQCLFPRAVRLLANNGRFSSRSTGLSLTE